VIAPSAKHVNPNTSTTQSTKSALFSPQTRLVLCLSTGSLSLCVMNSLSSCAVVRLEGSTFHSYPMRSAVTGPPLASELALIWKIYSTLRLRCFGGHKSNVLIDSVMTMTNCASCSSLFDPNHVHEDERWSSVCSLTVGFQIQNIGIGTGEWPISAAVGDHNATKSSIAALRLYNMCPPVSLDISATLHADAPDETWNECDVFTALSSFKLKIASESLATLFAIQTALLALSIASSDNIKLDSERTAAALSSSEEIIKPSFNSSSVLLQEIRMSARVDEIGLVLDGSSLQMDSVELSIVGLDAKFHQHAESWQADISLGTVSPKLLQGNTAYCLLSKRPSSISTTSASFNGQHLNASPRVAVKPDDFCWSFAGFSAIAPQVPLVSVTVIKTLQNSASLSNPPHSREQITVTVEISDFQVWLPLDVVSTVTKLLELATDSASKFTTQSIVSEVYHVPEHSTGAVHNSPVLVSKAEHRSPSLLALSDSDMKSNSLLDFELTAPPRLHTPRTDIRTASPRAASCKISNTAMDPNLLENIVGGYSIAPALQFSSANDDLSSYPMVQEHKVQTIVRVLVQKVGLLVYEKCNSADFEPGSMKFDAVELSFREVFILQSLPVYSVSASRWRESRARIEVTILGIELRSFDKCVVAPYDKWQILQVLYKKC
jgi:hypothetical protein